MGAVCREKNMRIEMVFKTYPMLKAKLYQEQIIKRES